MSKRKIDNGEKSRKMMGAFFLNSFEKASEQFCIHPHKFECTGEIIGSHNIQHNRILSLLAEDGHVYMPISDVFKKRLYLKKRGIRKQATVFTGFCSIHDKKVFSKIEDYPFYGTDEQLFLYAYKAFALMYYNIQREFKRDEILFNEYDFSSHIIFLYFRELHKLYKKFVEYELTNFNTCLSTQNYEIMRFFVGKLDYEVNFAVSSAFEIQYDLLENRIAHFPNEGKLSLVYLTVFPERGFSYYLISYFKDNDENYSGLLKQIESIPRHLLLKYLNNLIILNAENIVISPRLLNHWAENQIMDFENTIQNSLNDSLKGDCRDNYFASHSFSIFENI